LTRVQRKIAWSLEWFIHNIYRPFLNFTLNWRYLTLSIFVTILVISVTVVMSGRYKYTFFPRIESEIVSATLEMPEGTPIEITEKHINKMVSDNEFTETRNNDGSISVISQNESASAEEPIIQHILVTVGSAGRRPSGSSGVSNIGKVTFETIPRMAKIDRSDSRC